MPRPLPQQAPEFSRPVEIDRIGPEGVSLEIEADVAERDALARRFALASLERLSAALTVLPVSRRLFRVEGRLEAELVQTCVVTLEPVPAKLGETFTALFGEAGPGLGALHAESQDEMPEPIEGGAIDLGETVAQHLSLALDPYPRKPGAQLPGEFAAGDADAAKERASSPFAELDALKRPRR